MAARDLRPRGKRPDLHRRGAIGYIAKTKLAVNIFTPYPQRAVGLYSKRVIVSSPYLRPCRERAYLDRRGTVGCGRVRITEAELTFNISPPRPQCAVGLYSKRRHNSSIDCAPSSKRAYLHGGGTVGYIAETEGASAIASPRPQCAVVFGCNAMTVAHTNA